MKPVKFWLIISIVYCLVVITIEFAYVPVSGFYSIFINILQWSCISICVSGIFLFISSNRILFCVFFPPIIILSSIICYFKLTIRTGLTAQSIELALVNGTDMWWTLVTPLLLIIVIASVFLSTYICYFRIKFVKYTNKEYLTSLTIGIAITIAPYYILPIKGPVTNRLPHSIYTSLTTYLNNQKDIHQQRDTYKHISAEISDTPPDVVLILGESLRADHLPFNGYHRNTMPLLFCDSSIISFSNIYSKYYFTHTSLPHILTDSYKDEDSAYMEQSFITLFKKAGYKTIWVANQDLATSYNYFAHECDSLIICNTGSMYSYDAWLDSTMEPIIERLFNPETHNHPTLTILHTIGSHWWYKSHYTTHQARFLPDINHKDIGGLKKEAIINSYDNTILATDEFINNIKNKLVNENVILMYISDHGESLGEYGKYLHANDAEELHYPACFFWYSDKYNNNFPSKILKLKQNKDKRFETTYTFHTLLDLADITTEAYNENLSFLKQ